MGAISRVTNKKCCSISVDNLVETAFHSKMDFVYSNRSDKMWRGRPKKISLSIGLVMCLPRSNDISLIVEKVYFRPRKGARIGNGGDKNAAELC